MLYYLIILLYMNFERTLSLNNNTRLLENALNFPVARAILEEPHFYLYTRNNPENPILLNERRLSTTQFKIGAMTRLIVHGFTSDGNASWIISIKNNLLKLFDENVIVVHWQDLAKSVQKEFYTGAARNTMIVGNKTADFLKKNDFDFKKVHCIGHSLGAHCCGFIGKRYALQRITGLDPAGPLFYAFTNQNLDGWRLDKNHALFVDVIHTDINRFGIRISIGHQDFWPNYRSAYQPGCMLSVDPVCSHQRAPLFYAESILSKSKFPSSDKPLCGDHFFAWSDMRKSNCNNYTFPKMGHYAEHDRRGNFYLLTNREYPFSEVNGQIRYDNVRLSNHYHYTSLLSTAHECWNICFKDIICVAITFYSPNNCFFYKENFGYAKVVNWTSYSLIKIDL